MLRIEEGSLAFGGRALLDEVSWGVPDKGRMGLVGANGAGKSTLLRIAAGHQEMDGGNRQLTRGQTVGYLPQDGVESPEGQLLAVVKDARHDLVRLASRIEGHLAQLETLEANSANHNELLERLQQDQDAFAIGGGYSLESEAGRVLNGLGFPSTDHDKPCSSFSQGWQMRIALARLLLQHPSFLLLDEPTNHLDIESRTWLERFLDGYDGAVVVVSHDRHFLDRVVDRIIEIEGGAVTEYAGNYTSYEAAHDERVRRVTAEQAKQLQEVQRLQQFISRFRYDKRRASQVQSRIRTLAKMEKVDQPKTRRRVRFQFPQAPRCGSPVVLTKDLEVGYGAKPVLSDVELTVARGDNIAVVGPNGAGKSTLLRVLAGRQHAGGGHIELGHNVVTAYFAQDQLAEMNAESTVLKELQAATPQASEERLRGLLGAFLFEGDDVHKPLGVLSGGEINRLALAKILLTGANLLLLDEPTNHLDMASKDVLLEALRSFGGTVLFVSHDRYFVSALADRTVEVGDGTATLYPEGFEDFLWRKARELGHEGHRVSGVLAPDLWLLGERADTGEAPKKAKGGQAHKERIKKQRAEERRQRGIERTMARIEELEAAVEEIHETMAQPEMSTQYEELVSLQKKVDQKKKEIADLYEKWEGLQEG